MADYFPVNNGTPWGSKLAQFRRTLRDLVDLGRDIQGKANATVIGGTPDDFSRLESVFGLTPIGSETDTDSAGYKVLYQINGVMGRLDSDASQSGAKAAIQQFLDQVG